MAFERWACSGFQDQIIAFQGWKYTDKAHKWKEKVQKNALFPFFAKLSFQDFNLIFFKAEHLAYFSMPSGQWSIWRHFRYILYSMVKENTFIEGFFCIY